MALTNHQYDILNEKINTICTYGNHFGKNVTDDDKNLIKWYFSFKGNHKGISFMSLIRTLDNLITKVKYETIDAIIDGLINSSHAQYEQNLTTPKEIKEL